MATSERPGPVVVDPTAADVAAARPGEHAGSLAKGSLGPAHITFMVLAAAAPMAVVVAIMPIALALGTGRDAGHVRARGTLAAHLLLRVRAGGPVRAQRRRVLLVHRPRARAAAGAGRRLRRARGLQLAAAATCGALAFFAAGTANDLLGISLSWPVWAAIFIAVIALLSFRRITVTARLLASRSSRR